MNEIFINESQRKDILQYFQNLNKGKSLLKGSKKASFTNLNMITTQCVSGLFLISATFRSHVWISLKS